MASITLDHVNVEYTIFDGQSRSLKNTLINRVGGRMAQTDRNRVVVRALQDVTLSLKDGDRIGLIGRNGAGKSTLLKVLSGIYEPFSGRAEIKGTVSSLTDTTMGMDPDASGYENIITRAVFLGLSFAEAKALVPDIEEFSELGDYLNLPVRTYSSGMLTRLGFAVCTAVHPEILIMDEMIGTGDRIFFDKARARLKRMIDKSSIMVVASHVDVTIREFCNKVIVMREGRIEQIGPPEDMIQAYYLDEITRAAEAAAAKAEVS